MEEAELLGRLSPLQRFLSKPVSLSETAEVDGLSVGQVFSGDINLAKGGKRRRKEKEK